MSSTHSTWPVLLIPFNSPPWLCMKQSLILVSMVIPGEKAPSNDIDMYLQPLVKELLQLWEGVDAFDAYSKTTFKLRVALHSTINDFPALQTCLVGVQRVFMHVHHVLTKRILCGWKMDINFAIWGIKDGCVMTIHIVMMMLDLMVM